jgi:acetolactate synthase I/II/III large subunit
MNVGDYLVRAIESQGVDHVFGGCGQVNGSFMVALDGSRQIRTIITKNEQAASFMACGYSMFSGKLGVCFATGGPGAFNVMSGLAVALTDSLPVLAITGYEAGELLGKGALAETSGRYRTPDSMAMFAATTKKTYLLANPDQTCDMLEDALNTALEGRPGPVHIHVPIDLTTAEVPSPRKLSVQSAIVQPGAEQIAACAEAIAQAIGAGRRLMLLIGYGAVRSGADKELTELVERYQIPFATTMDAKGLIAESHPLSLGVYGTVGDDSAIDYFESADFVIAIGNSFAHNATFRFKDDLFAGKRLLHVNIDKDEINKVYNATYSLVSDARLAVRGLLSALSALGAPSGDSRVRADGAAVADFQAGKWYNDPINHAGQLIHPGELVTCMSRRLPPRSFVMSDAGEHMLWLSCYLHLDQGQIFQNPGSFGPMACGVNSAIGVKCAHPDRTVVSACGDGGYLLGGFELMTAVQYDIPVIWVIFNNGEFNSIKYFLNNIFGKAPFTEFKTPDFAAYARACGATGYRVDRLADFERAFTEALGLRKPVVIDAHVERDVYAPYRMSHY